MNRVLKITLTIITVISLGLLLYFELGLLITKHYSTAFFDPLEKTNVKFLGIITMLAVVITSRFYFKTIQDKIIFSSIIFFPIVGLTIMTLNLLDKSKKTVYRQDLGLQAYYLYLNDESKDYILEYTWPFGKSTLVGHFEKVGTKIMLDNDIVNALQLKGHPYKEPIISLDLENMEKIK